MSTRTRRPAGEPSEFRRRFDAASMQRSADGTTAGPKRSNGSVHFEFPRRTAKQAGVGREGGRVGGAGRTRSRPRSRRRPHGRGARSRMYSITNVGREREGVTHTRLYVCARTKRRDGTHWSLEASEELYQCVSPFRERSSLVLFCWFAQVHSCTGSRCLFSNLWVFWGFFGAFFSFSSLKLSQKKKVKKKRDARTMKEHAGVNLVNTLRGLSQPLPRTWGPRGVPPPPRGAVGPASQQLLGAGVAPVRPGARAHLEHVPAAQNCRGLGKAAPHTAYTCTTPWCYHWLGCPRAGRGR